MSRSPGSSRTLRKPRRAPAARPILGSRRRTRSPRARWALAVGVTALALLALWFVSTRIGRSRSKSVVGAALGDGASARLASSAEPVAPAAPDRPGDLAAHLEQARLALGRGDWTRAWTETQEVLKGSPGQPQALTYQALVRFAMGQPEAAILMLQQAQSEAPDLLDTYAITSLIYAKIGHLDLAQKTLEAAGDRFPTRRRLLGEMLEQLRAQVRDEDVVAASGSSLGLLVPAHRSQLDPPPVANLDRGLLRASGVVELDASVAHEADLAGVLFLIVRDATGHDGQPVALVRLESNEFPVHFAIRDGDSVLGRRLPSRLRIEARMDRDGDPTTIEPADLDAASEAFDAGASDLDLKLRPR